MEDMEWNMEENFSIEWNAMQGFEYEMEME